MRWGGCGRVGGRRGQVAATHALAPAKQTREPGCTCHTPPHPPDLLVLGQQEVAGQGLWVDLLLHAALRRRGAPLLLRRQAAEQAQDTSAPTVLRQR